MAASLAHQGIKVFLPLYSTFSQRAFDQLLNDVARSDHHVVIGIDRSGIVGEDGSTHQGLFDISMFYLMPNLVITMPYDAAEAEKLLYYGFMKQKHPFVIRYPRGLVKANGHEDLIIDEDLKPTWTKLETGTKLAMISYGPSLDLLIKVNTEHHLNATIINARFIKPIDEIMLKEVLDEHDTLFVYEEAVNTGALYPQILKFMAKHEYKNKMIEMSITDQIVEHGHYKDMLKKLKMDDEAIVERLKSFIS
jgi:1-deoxy-D-xylulose-5-phosphate synthase